MEETCTQSVGDQAVALFHNGYNCAEAVLLALAAAAGVPGSPLLPRLATGFGGGVARRQMICGALSGAILAINLTHGRDRAADPRDPAYTRVNRLLDEFGKRFGAHDCRALTGYDFADPAQVQANGDRVHEEVCPAFVRFAAEETKKLL